MRSIRANLFQTVWPARCLQRTPHTPFALLPKPQPLKAPILLLAQKRVPASIATIMSTQDPSIPPTPIKIHIPPALQCYTIPLRSFLARNPTYSRLVCSAFIFAPPSPSATDPRLLLLRRSATDVAFPGLWEIPGGSAGEDDPSILHSLAREVFEETGLRLARVVRQVGGGIEWTEEKKKKKGADGSTTTEIRKWLKLSFEIEVAEIGACSGHGGVEGYLASLPVEIDPEEHQEYAWVTEGDVRVFLEEGKGREIVSREQAEKMLRAFEVRRMGVEELVEEEKRVRRY